ncbi:glycoside hydrolase family 68 protein [Niallia sp. 03133]|uniref:glycoside hydrolase family 68 protein n=1 Tax=Niallia sp. 03133 TaxID=3458060 RepID=UPI004044ABB1
MYEVLYNNKKGFVRAADTATKPYSYTEGYGLSHITQAQMEQLPQQQNSNQFKVPVFDQNTIRNISSAKGEDKFSNLIDLDVWDTWPLQDANGQVATYNGYNIVFGLAGDPNDADDTKVYMFYQKVGEKSIDSWKLAGRVFKDSDKFAANDPILKQETQEWSGSAMLIDGEIRLFYTSFSNHYSKQTLATAQVNVSEADDETIKIEGVEDHKSIFDGDGKTYQNVQQFIDEGAYGTGDNHTLRDPHYIEDNGHKYLVFEANTGTEIGYHGDKSLYNTAYYGDDDNYYLETQTKLFNNGKKQLASLANGVLGIIEINDDFTLKNVLNPLITSNTVTDEIERANVFKLDGKWYLFTSSRGNKMAVDGITGEDIYMLGYVSDSLTGGYKPLNDTGLVLYMNLPKSDVTFTYAHYAIPQKQGNDVVVTSYMTNRGEHLTRRTTFAPSFLINIQGSTTKVNHDKILEQGQITLEEDASSYKK